MQYSFFYALEFLFIEFYWIHRTFNMGERINDSKLSIPTCNISHEYITVLIYQ